MCLSNIGKDHNTIWWYTYREKKKKYLTAIIMTQCVSGSFGPKVDFGAETLIKMRDAANS